ncbi:unnamed protein product [Haemonchus placei]|uniref:Uncharacterized protein n=1 Tax=Haemonchus placei TaxID=6290 RepID=A0A0N4WRZ8_HAEPC|nr:unnamed protein product [Haemonchus placei]
MKRFEVNLCSPPTDPSRATGLNCIPLLNVDFIDTKGGSRESETKFDARFPLTEELESRCRTTRSDLCPPIVDSETSSMTAFRSLISPQNSTGFGFITCLGPADSFASAKVILFPAVLTDVTRTSITCPTLISAPNRFASLATRSPRAVPKNCKITPPVSKTFTTTPTLTTPSYLAS